MQNEAVLRKNAFAEKENWAHILGPSLE